MLHILKANLRAFGSGELKTHINNSPQYACTFFNCNDIEIRIISGGLNMSICVFLFP